VKVLGAHEFRPLRREGLKIETEGQKQRSGYSENPLPPAIGWWRGVVGNAFRLKRSYSTPGPVSTVMGDCLRAGKPSRCEACQLGRLSLLPSVGW